MAATFIEIIGSGERKHLLNISQIKYVEKGSKAAHVYLVGNEFTTPIKLRITYEKFLEELDAAAGATTQVHSTVNNH